MTRTAMVVLCLLFASIHPSLAASQTPLEKMGKPPSRYKITTVRPSTGVDFKLIVAAASLGVDYKLRIIGASQDEAPIATPPLQRLRPRLGTGSVSDR